MGGGVLAHCTVDCTVPTVFMHINFFSQQRTTIFTNKRLEQNLKQLKTENQELRNSKQYVNTYPASQIITLDL